MTENITPETIEAVASPSKISILKSKITREGLILGGILAGATIAGIHVLLQAKPTVGEIQDLAENERANFVVIDGLSEAGSL